MAVDLIVGNGDLDIARDDAVDEADRTLAMKSVGSNGPVVVGRLDLHPVSGIVAQVGIGKGQAVAVGAVGGKNADGGAADRQMVEDNVIGILKLEDIAAGGRVVAVEDGDAAGVGWIVETFDAHA